MYLTNTKQRERITSFFLLAMVFPMQYWRLLALFIVRAHCGSWFACCPPEVLLCKADFRVVSSQHILLPMFIPTQKQNLAPPLIELKEVSLCPFLHPVKVPLNVWKTLWYTISLCFVPPANLLTACLVPSSRSLVKVWNSVGPSVNYWGTSVVSCPSLNFWPLTTILWTQMIRQFSIHLTDYLSNP